MTTRPMTNQRSNRRIGRHRLRILVASLGVALPFISLAHAAEVKTEGRSFIVPDGFVIERVAGPPLVDRPITAAFDDAGRLYVADSSGSNENVKKQLVEKPHRIVRLEDTDHDGKFDKQVIFADKMMFPEGTMWLNDSLYVSAPPSIWKLTDTNGDGVADQRTEWFRGKTLTGCANDLHGPYPGPDGWIYWCKGAFAQQTYERPGRAPLVTRASHIFRCRPEGGEIEPVMTGGMDNPVDVVFTPGGERIFTTTFLVNPNGGQRDGLIHAIYGGIYGKIQSAIFEPAHKWTGPEVMPVLLHMGPAAPCGLVRYEGDALGAGYRESVFACYFNLHKVGRHALATSGATFTTKDEDFVSSRDLDFHPTDLVEDADGSLLIVDTGGWYKLCCPTSQLQKPDVLGGIYRIRRKDAPKIDDPRGTDLLARIGDALDKRGLELLIQALGDSRPFVQRAAITRLAKLESESNGTVVPALRQFALNVNAAVVRRNAVWTLARINDTESRAVVREFLGDSDEVVRQAAIHVAGLAKDWASTAALLRILKGTSAQNRRAAAEALGRIGNKSAISALLEACSKADDRVTTHSITYALIEIGDPKRTAAGLTSADIRTKRVAMVALDQMEDGGLDATEVARLLASKEPLLKETASWIVGRHPEWAASLASVMSQYLDRAELSAAERSELETQLGRFAESAPIRSLLADRLGDSKATRVARMSALRAMAWATLSPAEVPAAWIKAIASVITANGQPADPELIQAAVTTARTLKPTGAGSSMLKTPLLQIANDEQRTAELRLDAMAALPNGLSETSSTLFSFLIEQLNNSRPVVIRTTAADVLASAKLSQPQLFKLAGAMRTAGPVEVGRLLGAFDQSTEETLGLLLIDELDNSLALTSLRIDSLKAHLAKYGDRVHKRAEDLYVRLNVDLPKQQARLQQLMGTLAAGDIRRGQLVFHSEKAACYSCHAIGYRGGNVGPDLTKIGSVRSQRDLLEAIVYPSASFVRSFEPLSVATTDGKVYNGLIRGESADELILAIGVNQESRIARREIDEIRPSTVSVMPAGLDQQLAPQELADLIAFLQACR